MKQISSLMQKLAVVTLLVIWGGVYAKAADEGSVTSGPPVEIVTDLKDMPARTVYLGLDKVEEAAGYDVQIKPMTERWAEAYRFKLHSEELRVRLTPGKYTVRTRSFDQKGKNGSWGPWRNFKISFNPPQNVYPSAGLAIDPAGSDSEKITFEWPKVTGAKAYLFKLADEEGKLLRVVRITRSWLVSSVNVTSKYQWCLIPLASLREAEDPAFPCTFIPFKVMAPSSAQQLAIIDVDPTPYALGYQFEFVRLKKKRGGTVEQASFFTSNTPEFKMKLASGQYELRARALFDEEMTSHWSSPRQFFVKIPAPKTELPLKEQVLEPTDDQASSATLKWEGSSAADRYSVFIFDAEGRSVLQENTRETQLTVHLPAGNSYKWHVVAYNADEPSRSPSSVKAEVNTTDTFSIKEYIKLELSVSEEPRQMYGWLGFTSSQVAYNSANYDNNSLISDQFLGSTAEAAVGYWQRGRNLGLLANGAISQITFPGKVARSFSGALNLGWRHPFSNGLRLRLWSGVAYEQSTDIQGNPYRGDYAVGNISNAGPRFQASIGGALTSKLGWTLYGSSYYGMFGVHTPNGMENIPQFTISASAFSVYRVSDLINAKVGYTFKEQKEAYWSADRPGKINNSSLTGHYFSLGLEFGIGPYVK